MRIPLKFNARAFAAFIFIALSFCVSLAHAQQQSPLLDTSRNDLLLKNSQLIDSKISDFVRDDILAKRGVKGMAMTVVRPDGEVEFGTWGVWNERNDEVGPNTLFGIGSCSKAFLVTSIGIVMEDYANGRNSTPLPSGLAYFDWDTKMKHLLPNDWKLQDRWASEFATVRDVLSHVSGLPGHEFSYSVEDTYLDVIRRLRYLQPTFELREKWSYSNPMYITATHLVSVLTGRPYSVFLRERIFDPLGLPRGTATVSPLEAEKSGNLSNSWYVKGNDTFRTPFWIKSSSAKLIEGAGGIIIDARGLSKWLKVLMNKGVRPDTNGTVIPRSVFDAMTTATVVMEGKGSIKYDMTMSLMGYGMGWWRQTIAGHEVIQHSGSTPGFKTIVAFFPEEKLGIASVYNTELLGKWGDTNMDVVARVIQSAFGTKVIEPVIPSVNRYDNKSQADTHSTVFPESLADLAGTYANRGYGNLSLCVPSTESDYCERVNQDFRKVDNAMGDERIVSMDPAPYQLLAAWPRYFTTHARFVYMSTSSRNASATQSIHKFAIQPTTLFPDGYGDESLHEGAEPDVRNSRRPFERPIIGDSIDAWPSVDFVVEDEIVLGFGMNLAPPDATRWMKERQSGDVKRDAFVWFERVY